MLPLAGIKVIELANMLPGPFCTLILADLGAEVIKIERPPLGDPIREIMPGAFESINRNKKSLCLDLKDDKAKEVLTNLIKQSDALIEGFRPGVADKLGFGYEKVRVFNERIIYCSISGYGQSGPYASLPGHDVNYLGVSGVLSISGDPQGPPAPWGGVQIADLCTSMYAALSITASLLAREKSGQGDYLDVSMADCLLSWAGPRLGEYFSRGKPVKGKFMNRGAYGAFQTKDGKYLALACVEDIFWKNLCRLLEREDLAQKKEYQSWSGRNAHANEINSILSKYFLEKDRAEWMTLLKNADIPCSPVNSFEELNHDPQISSKDLIHYRNNIPLVTFPVKFAKIKPEKIKTAPKLGEHNPEILVSLGYKENILQI
jgi:crotonobetainyl-CoA:carnitine CoA-transferase CaiB-like acyl-CoA transferase